jgi:hypothetical protein
VVPIMFLTTVGDTHANNGEHGVGNGAPKDEGAISVGHLRICWQVASLDMAVHKASLGAIITVRVSVGKGEDMTLPEHIGLRLAPRDRQLVLPMSFGCAP